ncbi:hypothetical protein GCM10022215_24340 [Nocardioides fonticola]|uniref:Uncharacterized protein n=1 Tax=Nocardioides fonticola TaxID=450363 RepID=A0ABP7XKR1_9ACTN
MSAAQSKAAVDRVADKRAQLGAESFGAYAFLVLAMLAHQAPEVVEFVMDQADRRNEDVEGIEAALTESDQ